jgi:CubicO group peptidase (beta-lactamase class C family)
MVKQRIDQIVETQMKQQRIPGLALAIVVDGKPFYLRGYGQANLQTREPVTVDTLFGIGSCSKAFTAFGVMLLVDEGKINVYDSIRRYLPETPPAWEEVTVRQLMSHTSGIPQHQGPHLPWEKTWRELAHRPFEFTPGSQTKYNNFGYQVLSRLIEVVSGQPYGHFMHARVFMPLGMHHTSLPAELHPRGLAFGYRVEQKGMQLIRHQKPWRQMWGSGGIVTTISDFAHWDQALATEKLLSPQAYRLMWTPVLLNNGKPSGWNLGWQIREADGKWKISKDGAITGYRSVIVRQVTDHIDIILLANTKTARLPRIARPLFQLMQQTLKQQESRFEEDEDDDQEDDVDDEQP